MARAKGKERKKLKQASAEGSRNGETAAAAAAGGSSSSSSATDPAQPVDLSGPYKYRPMRPSDPPFCAQDPLTGDQQQLFVWSYIAPGASRQRAEKVGLVIHGAFVRDGPEVDEFIARLHAAWPDFDIYKTSMGHWLTCPLPDNIDRLVPKKYDNSDLQKLMEQHRRKEEAIRKANVQRMKEVKKIQKQQVLAQLKQAKEKNVEPRKLLTEEERKTLEDLTCQPNPFQNYRIHEENDDTTSEAKHSSKIENIVDNNSP